MRPNQQNRRMRGRGNNSGGGGNSNNNRKGPNPLTRNYESNGPDVKIRGSAQQVADKYTTLARDAQSAGDRVMAENYLQHAEHYNRIIAAAMAQAPSGAQNYRDDEDDGSEDGDSDGQDFDGQRQNQPRQSDGEGPQPVIEGMPAEISLEGERPQQRDQRDRNFRNRDRNNRPPRDNREPRDMQPVAEQPAAEPAAAAPAAEMPQAAESAQPSDAVRKPRRLRRPSAEEAAPAGDDIGASGLLATLSRGALTPAED